MADFLRAAQARGVADSGASDHPGEGVAVDEESVARLSDPCEFANMYLTLLKAIRRELGHDDSRLSDRDLLRLYINDIDDICLDEFD